MLYHVVSQSLSSLTLSDQMIWVPKYGPLGASSHPCPKGTWKDFAGMPGLPEVLEGWAHPRLIQ